MSLGLTGRALLAFAIAAVLVEAGLYVTTGATSSALSPSEAVYWGFETFLIGAALIAGMEWLRPRG